MGPQYFIMLSMPLFTMLLFTMPKFTMLFIMLFTMPQHTTNLITDMKSQSTTALLLMLLNPLRFAPLLSRLSVKTLRFQPRSSSTQSSATQSPVLSVLKVCETQMVTVCQPTPGYGYHSYGHNYCKEVAQE